MKNLEIYEKNILLYKDKNVVSEYTKCESCLEYVVRHNECELKVSIDKNTHIISSTTVNAYGNNLYKQGIMNAFVELIIGMPILEANNHGVLRLENALRSNNITHTIKGIIMPENSCELFLIPLKLIRAIYTQYSKEQDYKPLVNTYSPKEIKKWKSLNIKDREKIVFEKIKIFCIKHEIEGYESRLIGDMRVEFSVNKELYPYLSKFLFDMETFISKELGFSLEIMFTEKKDTNKKRQN